MCKISINKKTLKKIMLINRDFYLNKLISKRQNGMIKVIIGLLHCA